MTQPVPTNDPHEKTARPADPYGPRMQAAPAPNASPLPLPALPLADSFGYYGMACLIFGLFYTFCFYKNPIGITWPLFTAAGFALLCTLFHHAGVSVKKDSCFLVGASFLLSLSMCLTASPILHFYNRLGLFLLLAVFLIHQLYDDRTWNIGKYTASILSYTASVFMALPLPFRHLSRYTKNGRFQKSRRLLIALAGVCASLPFALVVAALLCGADAVFLAFLSRLFKTVLNLRTLFGILFEAGLSAVFLYCILCTCHLRTLSVEVPDKRRGNPLAAVSFLALPALVYLLFCGIQIFYLFLGKGTLPAHMTYSEYARQGFFQLVFVVFLNLFLVLGCLKYFRSSRLLRLALALVSGCTYVMIASAAYRILLYIGRYRLTFLRLLVLWFLAMTAVLMAGILFLIFKERFPLCRYCIVVLSVFYTGFSLARPDAVIARYNLTAPGSLDSDDLDYLLGLSCDAAPALERYLPDSDYLERHFGKTRGELLYAFCPYEGEDTDRALPLSSAALTIRGYNFSVAKAFKIAKAAKASLP